MRFHLTTLSALSLLSLLTTATDLLPDGLVVAGTLGVFRPQQPASVGKRQCGVSYIDSSRSEPGCASNPYSYIADMYAPGGAFGGGGGGGGYVQECVTASYIRCQGQDFCCPQFAYCIPANEAFGIPENKCTTCPNAEDPRDTTVVCWDGETCCPNGKCSVNRGECGDGVAPSNQPTKGDDDASGGSSSGGSSSGGSSSGGSAGGDATTSSGNSAGGNSAGTSSGSASAGGNGNEASSSSGGSTKGTNASAKDDDDEESAAGREAATGWQVAAVVGIVGLNVLG